VYNKKVYFSNFSDQRLYCQDARSGAVPVPITPEGKQWRYADAEVALGGKVLVCVKEDHEVLKDGAKEPINMIVSINLETEKQHVLVRGIFIFIFFIFTLTMFRVNMFCYEGCPEYAQVRSESYLF